MTNRDTEVGKEYKDALHNYLENYFVTRSQEKVFDILSSDIRGFGTGISEVGIEPADYLALFQRDFDTIREPIQYTTYGLRYYAITDNVVVAMFHNDIEFSYEEQVIVLKKIRQSIVLRKTVNGVVIDHIHASLPAAIQGDNEAYPILQIKDITDQLHQVINAKTDTTTDDFRNLEKMVTTDYLTGLSNRYKIDDIISSEIKRANLFHSTFSIVLMDINKFKELNDTMGHLVGDTYLQKIAKVLQHYTRDTDLAGRWGGDEFVLVLPETNMYQTGQFCNRIRKGLKEELKEEITLSYGVSTFIKGDTVKSIFNRADNNLYKNKNKV